MQKQKREIKSITVGELIQELRNLPPRLKVFIASDSEGNSYSTLNKNRLFSITEDGKSVFIEAFEDHLEWEQIDEKADELIAEWDKEWERKRLEQETLDQEKLGNSK